MSRWSNLSLSSAMTWIIIITVSVIVTTGSLAQDQDADLKLAGRSKACDLFVGVDEPLYLRHGRNMSSLVSAALRHVSAANAVFARDVFTGDGHGGRYLRLKRVQVMYGVCDQVDLYEEKNNCSTKREEYLQQFDQ